MITKNSDASWLSPPPSNCYLQSKSSSLLPALSYILPPIQVPNIILGHCDDLTHSTPFIKFFYSGYRLKILSIPTDRTVK